MKNPIALLLHLIHHYFIWVIVASYFVAAILPAFGLWIRNADLGRIEVLHREVTFSLPLVMLAALLFNAGLGMKIEEVRNLLKNPLVLLGGVFGNLALSLGLVLLTKLLSPLLLPVVLHIVGFMATGDYSEDLHELASNGVGIFLGIALSCLRCSVS